MEDKNKQQEPQSLSQAVGCGSLLAVARKQQKKTVEEIAEELNLSVTQIRTIELDQSEGLPEPTYVRGYIRSYAKLLGLDAEEVLESYLHPNWQKTSSLDDIPRRIGNADDESTRFVTPAKVILLLVLAGVAGFLWWSGLLDDLMSTKFLILFALDPCRRKTLRDYSAPIRGNFLKANARKKPCVYVFEYDL